MTTQSSVLAWRIPGTPGQGGGRLVGRRLWVHRVGHDWSNLAAAVLNVPEVSEIALISFHSFLFILLSFSYFNILSSSLLIRSSARVILLLVSFSVFLISVIVLFTAVYFFFTSYRSLLNISCIFSSHTLILFVCVSILFPRFWIIFTIITLNFSLVDCLFPLHLFDLVVFYHIPHPLHISLFNFL